MPLYKYKAVAPDGNIEEGEMEARAHPAVIERLQSQGYVPIRAEEIKESAGGGWFASLRRSNRISQQDVGIVTQELATLLRAKLPLDRALEILIELSESQPVKQLITRVRERVHDGATLSDAMEGQKGVFSRLYLNMLRVGEASGSLDSVLIRLADYLERARELRETVTSALIYPIILLGVAVLSVLTLLLLVVPQFQQLFEDAGKALPFATQIVISLGDFLRHYGWTVILAAGGFAWYLRKQLAQPAGRLRWDLRLLKMPLIGDLVGKVEAARFSRTLGTMLSNGVPMLTALAIVKDTLSNRVLAEAMSGVSESLKQGRGLSQPLMEIGHFPRLAAHMVRVGEESGHLEEMLLQVADIYDKEVRSTVKRMLALLEPVLIVVLGLIIAGIIMSILVAILSINELAG
jgi:general secretion pathway protein F